MAAGLDYCGRRLDQRRHDPDHHKPGDQRELDTGSVLAHVPHSFHLVGVSTRVARSLQDLLRHGMECEVSCRCGHTAVLDAHKVYQLFGERKWSTSFSGLMDSAYAHFRCSKCGARPSRIGPGERG